MLILLTLFGEIANLSNGYLLAPSDHQYCRNRGKRLVMDRLTFDYRINAYTIKPNVSSPSISSLCSLTIFEYSREPVEKSLGKNRKIIWISLVKLSGEFSSCLSYVIVGGVSDSHNQTEILRSKKTGMKLNCWSKLPMVIPSRYKSMAVWWEWTKATFPRLKIEILSFIEFVGDFNDKEKRKICTQEMGFWCGDVCIDERMRCDRINDCIVFKTTQSVSTDELNCKNYPNNSINIGVKKLKLAIESFWISNILYILLSVVGLILVGSACKICISNFVLSKHLRTKKILQSTNSLRYSLSTVNSDNTSPYEDIYKYGETNSKNNSSLNISVNEETQEELLLESKDSIDEIYNNDVLHSQSVYQIKQDETEIGTLSTTVQLNSFQPSDLKSSLSNPTNCSVSITGSILSQGQNAISEMNSPGSSRMFRKIFTKNLNKTSSYDKILGKSDISSNSLTSKDKFTVKKGSEKLSSYPVSRCETLPSCYRDNEDDNFTSYVIV